MSKATHTFMCIMLTPWFGFASSVCFGSFKNLILSGFAREWCCFPSRRLPYTSICLSMGIFFLRSMCAISPLFVNFVSYLTFWHHTIQYYYRFSRIKFVSTILCCICHYGLDQALFRQLDVPLTRSLFVSHNFFATARKII